MFWRKALRNSSESTVWVNLTLPLYGPPMSELKGESHREGSGGGHNLQSFNFVN